MHAYIHTYSPFYRILIFFNIILLSLDTVTLAPKIVCVSPDVSEVTFNCMTTTTAILWIYNQTGVQIFYNNNDRPINVSEQLGVFSVQLTMVSADGNEYTSTATVNASSLVNITTLTISCNGNGTLVGQQHAQLINGMFKLLDTLFTTHSTLSLEPIVVVSCNV